MVMIPLKNGRWLNSAEVKFIDAPYGRPGETVLETATCKYETPLWAETVVNMINATVVPAHPGHVLLTCTSGESEEFWFSQDPIIAWRISGEGAPIAVVIDEGLEPTQNHTAILQMGGEVIEQYDRRFEQESKWETYARQRWEEERAAYLAKTPIKVG